MGNNKPDATLFSGIASTEYYELKTQKVMLKNYLNIAFRNLLKHRFYSILNILGLSIGLSCFMMISLFVKDELTYDQFHEDIDQIVRIDFEATLNGTDHISAQVGAPVAQAFLNDYPEVIDVTRLNETGSWFIREKGTQKTFKEETVLMADSNFFEFFTVQMIHGNPKTSLNRPNTLVMDQTTATKMFGNVNPVGKVLVLDNTTDYEVTGVYEDLPTNSHFHQNILLSMASFEGMANNQNWTSTNFNTYLKLQKGYAHQNLEAKFPEVIVKYLGPLVQKFLGMSLDEFMDAGNNIGFQLFPLADIHLYADKDGELEANGDMRYVYIFSAVALFILLLACINFMNLATARSAGRAKEVGVRKVMGAIKSQLINQFIAEAMVISLISFVIAFLLTLLAVPLFNDLANKELSAFQLMDPTYLTMMFGVMLLVGLFAGSYPAFYLSRFQPAEVLKGKIRVGMKSGALRSVLVVFQFSISIMLMIGTAVVFDQLSFIQNKKLGFNKDQVLMVEDAWILRDKVEPFKNEVLRNTAVANATISSFTPVGGAHNSDLHFKSPNPESDLSLVIDEAYIDYEFFETLGISMAEGRGFSKDYATDSSAAILNKAAAKMFGYEKPIGNKIYYHGGNGDEPEVIGLNIIGVVEDFHYKSLRNSITPMVFKLGQNNGYAVFKINTDRINTTVSEIESAWNEFAPGQPFTYAFMDQKFNSMYETEQKIGQIFTVFAMIGILIACLGLFGLASFTAEQKTKEIGIRKALGASVTSIVNLLSKNFIKLVLISFVVALPLAYYVMSLWLDDFAYRTVLKPVTFVMVGVLAFAIAWFTMGFQSWKAARLNPIKSLREE